MKMKYICSILLLLCVVATAFADDDIMDARTRMKVNRAKRHQSMDDKVADAVLGAGAAAQQKGGSDPCAGVQVGNVYTDRRGATPRENTVVVTGDVINVPSNRCR